MGQKVGLKSAELEIQSGRVIVDRCLEPESRIVLAKDEFLRVILLPLGENRQKRLEVFLKGEGSRVEVLGALLGKGQEKSYLTVNIIHQGLNTSAFTHVRGVLFDQSQTQFCGMIKIEKGANQTTSLLENRVLILGAAARAESVPMLEIEADEVKASHAATVGQIDERQIFYLESRGVERHTAVRMIIEGFFEPILGRIGQEKVVAQIRGELWTDVLRG